MHRTAGRSSATRHGTRQSCTEAAVHLERCLAQAQPPLNPKMAQPPHREPHELSAPNYPTTTGVPVSSRSGILTRGGKRWRSSVLQAAARAVALPIDLATRWRSALHDERHCCALMTPSASSRSPMYGHRGVSAPLWSSRGKLKPSRRQTVTLKELESAHSSSKAAPCPNTVFAHNIRQSQPPARIQSAHNSKA